MARRHPISDESVSTLRLARDMQAALDEAEAAHRAALAAYRRAGDKLHELTLAIRSWSAQPVMTNAKEPAQALPSEPRETGPASPPLLVSIREASQIAGIGKSTMWRNLGNGAFTARKVGNRTLIEYASLIAWMESLPVWSGSLTPRPQRG